MSNVNTVTISLKDYEELKAIKSAMQAGKLILSHQYDFYHLPVIQYITRDDALAYLTKNLNDLTSAYQAALREMEQKIEASEKNVRTLTKENTTLQAKIEELNEKLDNANLERGFLRRSFWRL